MVSPVRFSAPGAGGGGEPFSLPSLADFTLPLPAGLLRLAPAFRPGSPDGEEDEDTVLCKVFIIHQHVSRIACSTRITVTFTITILVSRCAFCRTQSWERWRRGRT